MYALAAAILVVGLVWAGVPASTLLLGAAVLACPIMMITMMRGMHGEQSGHHHTDTQPPARPDRDEHLDHDARPRY
jgi:hypothetical protein